MKYKITLDGKPLAPEEGLFGFAIVATSRMQLDFEYAEKRYSVQFFSTQKSVTSIDMVTKGAA